MAKEKALLPNDPVTAHLTDPSRCRPSTCRQN